VTDDARNTLLVELGVEFRKGRIYERPIPDDDSVWDAFVEHVSGEIVIDPVQWLVETLLHELLHRRYPRWGEKRVSDTARRLMQWMPSEERRSWYRAYQRSVVRSPRATE
jgi:hypothetical protein